MWESLASQVSELKESFHEEKAQCAFCRLESRPVSFLLLSPCKLALSKARLSSCGKLVSRCICCCFFSYTRQKHSFPPRSKPNFPPLPINPEAATAKWLVLYQEFTLGIFVFLHCAGVRLSCLIHYHWPAAKHLTCEDLSCSCNTQKDLTPLCPVQLSLDLVFNHSISSNANEEPSCVVPSLSSQWPAL